MALIPKNRYPAQTDDTDPDYPHGKARNAGAPGDGNGTPFERDLVNDIWGFLQALLEESGVTPSGSPDTASNSQYLQALGSVLVRRDQQVDVQIFTDASDTWTKPSWASATTPVRVILQGDGGGGGEPSDTNPAGCGGGGSGWFDEVTLLAGLLSATEPVTVGQGGSGDGDGCSFGSGDYQLMVPGGKAGAAGSSSGKGGDGFSGGGAGGAPGGSGGVGGSHGGDGGSPSNSGGSGARPGYPAASFGVPGAGGEPVFQGVANPGTGGTGFGAGGGGLASTTTDGGGGGGGAAGWTGIPGYPEADDGGHESGKPGVVVVITG